MVTSTLQSAAVAAPLPVSMSMQIPGSSDNHAVLDAKMVDTKEDVSGLGDDLKQREYEIIVSTLREERGSKKNTAERLGISPRTLRYKIARLKEIGLDIGAAY